MTRERPIIFSTPMVRAILDDRKTQTRRTFAPERITLDDDDHFETHAMRKGELVFTGFGKLIPNDRLPYCPYGQPGDRLWA